MGVEESKHRRSTSNLNRGKSNEKKQPMLKKSVPTNIDLVLLRSTLRVIVVLKAVSLLAVLVGRSTLGSV